MKNRSDKEMLSDELMNKKYIDDYIEKWLKMDDVDRPYVVCEVCSYASNASIHQHLLVPEEFRPDSNRNQILHLCSNCYYEHRALIDKYRLMKPQENIHQVCEEAFGDLKDMKKRYSEMNKTLERVEI
jgi:hypothetical protein